MRRRSHKDGSNKVKQLNFPPVEELPPDPPAACVKPRGRKGRNMATQTDLLDAAPLLEDVPPQPSFVADIMAAIAICQATLTTKIKAMQLEIVLMRQDVDKLRSRVTKAEERVGAVEDTVAEHPGHTT